MNTGAAYGLMGLGCDCQRTTSHGIGGATDYDVIVIGGKQYSANQILDKTLIASSDVKLYRGADFNAPFATVKSGQPIGKVYSYIKASGPTGQRAGGPLLEFLDNSGRSFYVKDDKAISQTALQQQGTKTVTEEIKKEQEELAKQNDPVGFYLKKYGLPVLLIGGGIYLAATYGKAFIQGKLSQPKTATA